MCNIHFIKPINGKIKEEHIEQLLKMLDTSSTVNRDGFGMFTPKQKYRIAKKYEPTTYITNKITETLMDADFIVGHSRYQTTGKITLKHTHPLETANLLFVHNGNITNFKQIHKDIEHDTMAIGYAIEQELAKGSKIVKAISKGLGNLCGYLSMFIYHKKSKRLFYMVKGASFEFRLLRNEKGEKIIVGNTLLTNLAEFGEETGEEHSFKIKDYATVGIFDLYQNFIYEITKDNIKKVGEFTLKPEPSITCANEIGYWERNHSAKYNRNITTEGDAIIHDAKSNWIADKDALIAGGLPDDITREEAGMIGALKRTVWKQVTNRELTNVLGGGTHIKDVTSNPRLFDIYTNKASRKLMKRLGIETRLQTPEEIDETIGRLEIYRNKNTKLNPIGEDDEVAMTNAFEERYGNGYKDMRHITQEY